SLWVTANQCAGASAACVQAINQLNTRLNTRLGDSGYVPNHCYSLAINSNLAQLHVSWRVEEDGKQVFYIQRVASFSLCSAKHFVRLHQWMMAILDWGRGQRLRDI
ncbi:hypothetical protein B0T26DRAFT_657911, partial [Lasiosphaeria miniovina]